MTICIAFCFLDYVLLAADTRVTTQWPDGSETTKDDKAKVEQSGIGLITGAGFSPLIDWVARRIRDQIVGSTTDILSVIEGERARVRRTRCLGALRPDVEEWIERTWWFYSHTTLVDERLALMVSVEHPTMVAKKSEDYVWLLPSNSALIIAPGEASPHEADVLSEAANEFLLPTSDFDTLDEHFAHHRDLCGALVRSAADRYASVSPFMNVGIHTIDGQIDTTGRIQVGASM